MWEGQNWFSGSQACEEAWPECSQTLVHPVEKEQRTESAAHRLGTVSRLKEKFWLVPWVIVLSLEEAGLVVVMAGSTKRPSMGD